MAISKLILNGVTQMDLTTDTVTNSAHIMSGYIGHLADGTQVTGTGQGGGGSSSGQTVTGTITGTGTNILEIPCAFAPDTIYIYSDLSDDVTKRGVADFYLIKDFAMYIGRDSSSSNNDVYYQKWLITGYGDDSSQPYASYSNNILTINTVLNSSAIRWLSGQTYTYELTSFGSAPSATQHTIHLGFSDSTSTDINVYYDDTLLNTMITNYNPTIYGGKAVTLAQLDNVAWYEPLNIPLNTQLIDYTKCVSGYRVDSSGELTEEEWAWVSDYTVIDPSMTFSYIGYSWWDICFYDSSKTFISYFRMHDDDGVTIDNNDYAHGTLTPSKIPSNAMYIRIDALGNNSDSMSLIRTA